MEKAILADGLFRHAGFFGGTELPEIYCMVNFSLSRYTM